MQQKGVTYAQLENSNGKSENTEEIFYITAEDFLKLITNAKPQIQ